VWFNPYCIVLTLYCILYRSLHPVLYYVVSTLYYSVLCILCNVYKMCTLYCNTAVGMYSVKVLYGAYSITYCVVFTLDCHVWYVLCTVVVVTFVWILSKNSVSVLCKVHCSVLYSLLLCTIL
jgi:hypothetical protein